MIKYIPLEPLVAEIERRLHQLTDAAFDSMIGRNLIEIKDFLNTLEVKEVELEKEYKDFVEEDPVYNKLVNGIVGRAIAKHFFELGMAVSIKAQKGE